MTKKIKFISLMLAITIFLSGCGLKILSKKVKQIMRPIELNYWRIWDESDDFSGIIAAYTAIHPNVTIKYKKLRFSEYENELLEAFATDRGPDIFSVHNSWMKKYQAMKLIEAMPPTTTMVYPTIRGTIKKEMIPEARETASIGFKKLKDDFVDVVYDDVVIEVPEEDNKSTKELIFGLPLAIDTLALYYNKDLFNNAGIIKPPKYWNREFQQNVKKLTKQNTRGQIIQSGVALGGSDNIERYSDILSALMMQNGTVMMNETGLVLFNIPPPTQKDKGYNPGIEALRFYADFANPAKEVYSWNKTLDNSLDMFIQGKLAMFFGYSYHLPIIQARAPKLNFSIAPLPQIEGNPSVNLANYWIEVVSKKILTDQKNLQQGKDYAKQKSDAAWNFVQFAAKAENVKSYLENSKKITALRGLIEEQIDDIDIGIFTDQLLTAESWYRGVDANAAEKIIGEMIDDVVAGQSDIGDIIDIGARKVQQTIYKKKEE